MSVIEWDGVGTKLFEIGLDRGVLYDLDSGKGIPWNGLLSVNKQSSAAVDPLYFNGVKFEDSVSAEEPTYILRAFTYPDEFLEYEGLLEDDDGLYLDDQPPTRFHLCWRTGVGNDTEGLQHGYKIHILYNVLAVSSTKSYSTVSSNVDPIEFEWTLYPLPEEIGEYKPTSHIVIDSRKIDQLLLADIEDILYGSEDNDPSMPSLQGLITFIQNWDRFIVIDNGDGTWTGSASIAGYITKVNEYTYDITTDTIVVVDAETYDISSTEKNEVV